MRCRLFAACLVAAALSVPWQHAAAQSAPAPAASTPAPGPNSVVMMAGNNVSRGDNFFVYYALSHKDVLVRPGDKLEYDIFIPANSTETNGGVDLDWTDESTALRDLNVTDQRRLSPHPKTVLNRAKNRWYHRIIPLDLAAGKHVADWALVFEGDTPGAYAFFVGKLGIHHADGSWDWAYNGGPLPSDARLISNNGYSKEIVLRPVPRSWVNAGNVDTVIGNQMASYRRDVEVREFQHDIEYVEKFAKGAPDAAPYQGYIASARKMLDRIHADPNMSAEQIAAVLTAGREQLGHTHPLMQSFTGYLVGHSHIDFQWLWEWPESYEICRSTFGTITNLMDEFPGFGFSQSSSALYKATQDYFPDVFKRIQQKVKTGQWDIVGGRVCEGDTNLISPESHARHFLLGQRYFRKNFGKTATVGWEPDTFGHTWSMPEILKMGGCDYYYFCRGGKNQPLFWWEGPDGTKVLAFDEPASGSWYDGGLGNETLNEMLPWYDKTGTKSIMWIYGVGDHGGGVTREQIREGQRWSKNAYYPNVKFTTATKFFQALEKQPKAKVPTIKDELNPVFEGCYTSQSAMKRLNRDAENITASAETVATVASLFGQPYPTQTFDDNWEGICFNHHHDTLPGSAIHESYEKTREQLSAIVASSRNIAGDSLRFLATFLKQPGNATYSVVAFNPLSWAHGGPVEITWPFQPRDIVWRSSWPGNQLGPDRQAATSQDENWVAVSPDGEVVPVVVTRGTREDNPQGRATATFTVSSVPGFGYRVYALRLATPADKLADRATARRDGDNYVVENGRLRAVVAPNGEVTSLFDKARNREMVMAGGSANRLEIWGEGPWASSGWGGRYTEHEVLKTPAEISILENLAGRATIKIVRRYHNSTIVQHVSLRAGSDQLDTPLWVDWQEIGEHTGPAPDLTLVSDVAGNDLKASYEIPFATIQRPLDGREVVALKSADLSNEDGGLTLLNDCKDGHMAEGNSLRLTVVRTSSDPDRLPDQGPQFVNTALVPHAGVYGSDQVRKGFAFNQAFLSARVPPSANGTLPLERSFVTVDGSTVVGTVLKRSEENPKAMVVRFYEANGTPAKVSISAATPVVATRWVNFVEDPLSGITAGGATSANLHKYEIRNVELFQEKPIIARPKPLGPRPTPIPLSAPTPLQRHPQK